MGFIRSVARRVDRFQEHRPWVAFPYAVLRKFGDDDAGNLAALIAYYGFFSLFPLLLVFTAMLGVLGVITVVSATVSGVASGNGIPWRAAAGIGASLGLNFAAFLLAFRFLTSADVSWSDVRPGAAVAAMVWTGLEAAGGFVVAHQIR